MLHKKFPLAISLLFLLSQFAKGQDSSGVQWTTTGKKLSGNQYELHFKGAIKKNWHLYAKDKQAEGLEGIKVLAADSGIQIEPGVEILDQPKTIADPIFDNKKIEVAETGIELIQKIHFGSAVPSKLKVTLSYFIGNINSDPPQFLQEDQKFTFEIEGGTDLSATNRILIPAIDLANPVNACGGTGITSANGSNSGLLTLFLLGFLGGLIALLTPCVFPMIPLTVSFFTKKATSRNKGISNAVLYGLFIFLIYVALSLPFHFLDKLNPEILNSISTNVYLNVAFFLIFIFFAFSFFGYYEISLPSSFSSKADSKSGAGNVTGIFFMALTLALVSFSCTGPILGSLLAGSLSGNGGAMQLTVGMGGFGLALALPFALFALFPNWLKSLPRSGSWLDTVKVVLGFLELALAFKFLSNADLVKHWGILKREIFIAIWILCGTGLTLYLFGKLRFSHYYINPIKKLGQIRVALAIIAGAFTVYLIPGVTNTKWANLSLISGFPPPLYYSIYAKGSDCVLGLNCSKDYEMGLKTARAENKPILLDFTGYACVNCRRMEENVWSRPEIFKIMKEKFVVISLYVDDKKKLPSASQFTYISKDSTEKEIVTVGDKWATFETENFRNNAQPLYAIIGTGETLLNNPVGYTPDAQEYKNWLECGLEAFAKSRQK